MTSACRHRAIALALTATLLLCGGCRGDLLNSYSEYHRLPPDGWSYRDILTFTPVHADSICEGELVVGLRHAANYPFTSLWLAVEYTDNGRPARDTVEVPLSDIYGRWLGKGIGTDFQTTAPAARLRHASGSEIKIRHAMRCDTLTGIGQIGIFFFPDNNPTRPSVPFP